MTADAPTASVVTVRRGRVAVIACPYCGARHEHQVDRLGRDEWRAPACGLSCSADQRAAGYRFTTPRYEPPTRPRHAAGATTPKEQ
jgi:sarcosine oxidase delta subunit